MTIEADFFEFMATAFPTTAIAYPAVDFTPPKDAAWIELAVFRDEALDGVPPSFSPRNRGTLQATAVSRAGNGIFTAIDLAYEVQAALPNGTKFNDGLHTSTTPNVLSTIVEADKIKIPVSTRYST